MDAHDAQSTVADMVMALEGIEPHLEHVAQEWSSGVDHGAAWPARIVSAKHCAVDACWKIADLAMELSGGGGMFNWLFR